MGRVTRQVTDLGQKLKVALDIDKMTAQVGWLDGARYDDKNATPVSYVATILEYGYAKGGIRPYAFVRKTVSLRQAAWGQLAESGARAMLAGNASPEDVLEGLGLQAEGDIRKTIAQIKSPPLHPSTIKNRQRKLANGKKIGNLTKPLVESALMINSLSSEVVRK